MTLLSVDPLIPGPKPIQGEDTINCYACNRPTAVSELSPLPTEACSEEFGGDATGWCGRCRREHASFCADCAVSEFDYGDDIDPFD